MIFDKHLIQENLISWINDITIKTIRKKYIYISNDLDSNLGEPSKSYMTGQFYYDPDSEAVYLSLLLDPNLAWGYKYDPKEVYGYIIDYIDKVKTRSLLSGLKIEFLFSESSILENHEANSKCRTEENNNYLFGDTVYLWKNIHDKYTFIRDSGVLIQNKNKVIFNTGKTSFKDYSQEIKELNKSYPRLDLNNDELPNIFEEYQTIYSSYFNYTPKVINQNDVMKFYLLNYTDYCIKEKLD